MNKELIIINWSFWLILRFRIHPEFLRSRLVAVEIIPPSIRSRKGKYVLPPVLILPLFLVILSCPNEISFFLPNNSQLLIYVNVVGCSQACIFCTRWALAAFIINSCPSIRWFRYEWDLLWLAKKVVQKLINCRFVFPSYSVSWRPDKR